MEFLRTRIINIGANILGTCYSKVKIGYLELDELEELEDDEELLLLERFFKNMHAI